MSNLPGRDELPPLEWSGFDDYSHRTCSVCGGDCIPEGEGSEEVGVRIVFVCPLHGLHSIIDPLQARR